MISIFGKPSMLVLKLGSHDSAWHRHFASLYQQQDGSKIVAASKIALTADECNYTGLLADQIKRSL
jgi:hypothetical protein